MLISEETDLQNTKNFFKFQNKPVILVAHQFAGDSLANFNATVRQLKVGLKQGKQVCKIEE